MIRSLALAVAIAAPVAVAAQPARSERAFAFREVRPGIYHAVGTGSLAVGCNGAVVVNDADVLIVDSHMTPRAARALLDELVEITDKPVRYVVNTHFHFDHVQGNQVFGPGVEIVAHEFTREQIVTGATRRGRAYDSFIATLPEQIAALERERADADPAKRAELDERIRGMRALHEADAEVRLTPPGMTLGRSLTLHRGGREIRLLFFGRGHTGGDVLVYLPQERVLVTGDLVTAGLPYMGDGFLLEWAETLDQVRALDFDVILPGHGEAFEDRERVAHLQAYLRELWEKAAELHAQGVPAAEAAQRIDMSAHAAHFPQIAGPGVQPHAVERVYELLDAEG